MITQDDLAYAHAEDVVELLVLKRSTFGYGLPECDMKLLW